MTRRILVTGGSGFLGSAVIERLVALGDDVIALARSDEAARRVEALGATSIAGDLDDPASLDRSFAAAEADALVNIASLGFGQAPAIVAAAAEAGLSRGIYVSSTAIFTTLDAPSKPRRTAGEDAVTSTSLEWTVVRPTMIYGTPGDRNLARLLQIMGRAPVLPLPGGGARLQQPVHVDDLAAAIVTALERPESIRRAYNLAGPEAITFRQLLEQAGDAVGRRPRMIAVPLGATTAAVRLYERVSPRPRLKAEQLERLSEDKAFDISDARTDLDFDPRPFAVGIAQEAALLRGERPAPHPPSNVVPSTSGIRTGAANDPTLDHFEDVADSWIRRYDERPSFRHRLDVVGRVVTDIGAGFDRAPYVLDFGGGPGVFSMVASTVASRVVCLDASAPMIIAGAVHADLAVALATRFGTPHPEHVDRVVGTVDTLAPTPTFDLVITIAVLEYLDDPAETVEALAARLHPGGRLLLTVPDARSLFRRTENLVGSLGAGLGRVVRSQRLSSRAYASVRPQGNQVPWKDGADRAGLTLERIVPLTLAATGAMSRVTATSIIVLQKRGPGPGMRETPDR